MQHQTYAKQVRTVLTFELVLVGVGFLIAYTFWTSLCAGSLESCVAKGPVTGPATFLLLSLIRPFVVTPLLFVAIVGGKTFGPLAGAFWTALGSVFSCLAIYAISKFIGNRLAKPWLRSNLPATFGFLRSQDYKLVFAARMIPFVPFDAASFVFGAFDFRLKSVAIATFFGTLPEAYLFAKLAQDGSAFSGSAAATLGAFAGLVLVPLLIFEFVSRKKGTGLWQTTKAMYREITYEVQSNNEILRKFEYQKDSTPVLLLYGFFSSRRAVTVLERQISARGHPVLTFNLGGLLNTFFTRDIIETAHFIDYKLRRQFERHGFDKVNIVSHSKGGLVALWWLLKLGGARHCNKVITMGTPFRGTWLTYLALVTPLGFLWKDVWQMRPGSMFLKALHEAPIPEDLEIFCLHSRRDGVAYGENGIFSPEDPGARVHPINMDHIGHFEFLYKRDVGDTIARILDADHQQAEPWDESSGRAGKPTG